MLPCLRRGNRTLPGKLDRGSAIRLRTGQERPKPDLIPRFHPAVTLTLRKTAVQPGLFPDRPVSSTGRPYDEQGGIMMRSCSLERPFQWESLLAELAVPLQSFLPGQRWFAGKSGGIQAVRCQDVLPLRHAAGDRQPALALLEVIASDGRVTSYLLPLVAVEQVSGSSPAAAGPPSPGSRIADLSGWSVFECSRDPEFWRCLLTAIMQQTSGLLTSGGRTLTLQRTGFDIGLNAQELAGLSLRVSGAEQSNTSVLLGERGFLKLFRRAVPGINPDAEISRFLTERTEYRGCPPLAGTFDLSGPEGTRCVALLAGQVRVQSDAWQFTLDELGRFWQRARERFPAALSPAETTARVIELLNGFDQKARLLGQRTGELHVALSSDSQSPEFAPEPMPSEGLTAQISRIEQELQSTLQLLRQVSGQLPEEIRPTPDAVRQIDDLCRQRLDEFRGIRLTGDEVSVIRCHGDYHLGQVLWTGADFVIIDFEGEPERPIEERREKRCALKDVAGMVRSLHYASNAALVGLLPAPDPSIAAAPAVHNAWFAITSAAFLSGWEKAARSTGFNPQSDRLRRQLLELFLLEKVLYELRYELNNRPAWVRIPLTGLKSVLGIQD